MAGGGGGGGSTMLHVKSLVVDANKQTAHRHTHTLGVLATTYTSQCQLNAARLCHGPGEVAVHVNAAF